jgi:hypothetical protein
MVGKWVDSNVLAVFTIIHFIRIIGCKYGGAVGGACQQVEESTAVIVFGIDNELVAPSPDNGIGISSCVDFSENAGLPKEAC